MGQFLPHPLNALSDVIGRFHPFHVHCVLVDLWNFMKDHVPSPVAFVSKEGPGGEINISYMKVLYRMSTTPHIFSLMFIGPLSRDFEEQSPAGKNYRSYFERLRLVMIHHVSEMPQVH